MTPFRGWNSMGLNYIAQVQCERIYDYYSQFFLPSLVTGFYVNLFHFCSTYVREHIRKCFGDYSTAVFEYRQISHTNAACSRIHSISSSKQMLSQLNRSLFEQIWVVFFIFQCIFHCIRIERKIESRKKRKNCLKHEKRHPIGGQCLFVEVFRITNKLWQTVCRTQMQTYTLIHTHTYTQMEETVFDIA